jgi:hypothetical protein
MHCFKPIAALMAAGFAIAPAIVHADDSVAALRAELQTLKADYDARVAALESRLGSSKPRRRGRGNGTGAGCKRPALG